METQKRIPVLVDTDFGDDVDDTAALIMLMNSPELELKGITTVYKDTVKRAEMVKDLLSRKGLGDVPVCPGAGVAMIESTDMDPPLQYEILRKRLQETAETACPEKAARFIIDQVKENRDLVVVELGMMTNLAIAFLMDPETMKKAKIIGMGGEFADLLPEWNIVCDPEAARIVMDRAETLTLFGLDITKHSFVNEEKLDRMSQTDIMEYFREGIKIFRKETGYPVTLHDAVPIAWLLCPEIAELEQCDYTVALEGRATRGTVIKQKDAYRLNTQCKKQHYYAKKLDYNRFFELVSERLR